MTTALTTIGVAALIICLGQLIALAVASWYFIIFVENDFRPPPDYSQGSPKAKKAAEVSPLVWDQTDAA
jgi:hypothetical protein